MAMSGEWGVHKPMPEFYERALDEMKAHAPATSPTLATGLTTTSDLPPLPECDPFSCAADLGASSQKATIPDGTLVVDSLG